MTGRIARVCRGSGAALAGLAAVALSACGLRTPVGVAPATGTPTATPTATPSPTGSGTPSASATPTGSPTSQASATPSTSVTSTTAAPTTPPTTPPGTPSPTSTPEPTPHVVVGRPLRQRRRALLPGVTSGGASGVAAVHPDAARLGALPPGMRSELARLWLGAARGEHASVPAFAEVALLLSAAGAPLDLLAAAHRAALDEVEHTRVSYALANAYGGTAHVPGALPRLLGRRLGGWRRGRATLLRRLALEALREGCLNEGYAAALAAAGAAAATDPAPRGALTAIAREEAAHAELSWRILGWTLAEGGEPVAAAVARATRSLPAATAAPADRDDLERHGWPGPATAAAAYAAVRADVGSRAAGLVALARRPAATR